jgi:hypothetical protein
VRTIQDVDDERTLIVKVRANARSFGAPPTTGLADQLLDERLRIIGTAAVSAPIASG